MPGVYRLEIHSGQIWKRLRPDHEVSQALVKSFKHKRARDRFRHVIETSHQLPYIGRNIVNGLLFQTTPFGGYRSPFLSGHTLAEQDKLEQMSLCVRMRCVLAVSALCTALRKFVHRTGYLIGDWGLHNMIWNESMDTIYNIDLEGFYTYGPNGLHLSWKGDEANLPKILSQLTRVQRKIIRSMQPFTLHGDPLLHTVTHLNLPQPFYVPFRLDRVVDYPTRQYDVSASSEDYYTRTIYLHWVHGEIRSKIFGSEEAHRWKKSIPWFKIKCLANGATWAPTAYLINHTLQQSPGETPLWIVDSRIRSI